MDATGGLVLRAHLINVSTGGALILTERVAESSRLYWIRLERSPEIGWVIAKPVRFRQPNEVGMRFIGPCPQDFFTRCILPVERRWLVSSDEETHLDNLQPESWMPPNEN
jgi:hypothetical protein